MLEPHNDGVMFSREHQVSRALCEKITPHATEKARFVRLWPRWKMRHDSTSSPTPHPPNHSLRRKPTYPRGNNCSSLTVNGSTSYARFASCGTGRRRNSARACLYSAKEKVLPQRHAPDWSAWQPGEQRGEDAVKYFRILSRVSW